MCVFVYAHSRAWLNSRSTLKNLGFVSEPKEQLLGKGGAWTEVLECVVPKGVSLTVVRHYLNQCAALLLLLL